MKKLFLLGLAVASTASMAHADEYVSGGSDIYKEGYAISVEWANLDLVGTPGWVALGKRTAAGANDKIYVSNMDDNCISVYGPKGLVTNIAIPTGNMWAGSSVDQNGTIIMRGSENKWPGDGAYGGCYYTGSKNGNLFFFVDSKTDKFATDAPAVLDCATGRADAFGFTMGNVLSGDTPAFLCGDGTMGLANLYYDGANNIMGGEDFPLTINPAFANTGVGAPKVQGVAQAYGEINEAGVYANVAVAANFDAPSGEDVLSKNGLNNYIELYTYGVNETTELEAYNPTDKFFITPQHGGLSGFVIFEVGGKEYIAYPVAAASDALAISELALADTPVADPEMDKQYLIARHFASVNDAGGVKYGAATTAPMSMSVEPVEGDANSIYIYTYCQFGAMMKYKFTAPTAGGIEGVTVTEDENAPVEYFNLNGVRVANPEGGVFIRKQGAKATKVIR